MEIILILSFLLFMGFFATVGLSSIRGQENTTDDYLVAGRGMHPGLAALSLLVPGTVDTCHRVHWIHVYHRLFCHLDRSGIHNWTDRSMDMVVQIYPRASK